MLDITKLHPHRVKRYACPCCGTALDEPLGNTQRPLLGAVAQRIFNVVKSCPDGIQVRDLQDRVYGAQDRCEKLIATHVWQMNKKLEKWGLRIASSGGPGSLYRLTQI